MLQSRNNAQKCGTANGRGPSAPPVLAWSGGPATKSGPLLTGNPEADAEDGSCEYPPLWPGGAAEWDTDGDNVLEAFPAWITEPVNVTLPDGCVDDNCIGQSFTKDLPNGARHDAHGTHHGILMTVGAPTTTEYK